MSDLTGSLARAASFPAHVTGRQAADAMHFARALIEPARHVLQARARIAGGGWPEAGAAVDAILLDGPARVTSATIDHAFGRDGSIWGTAGAESTRPSDPADFIFGAAGLDVRPVARLVAAQRRTSDTIDMIFSGGGS